MDPDAPPLVKADTFASQGEQLASRRAYQQAHQAHAEAAKQYQLAAQATGDTGAAKALLLQRDKQLKLAGDVLRKLERGKTKPVIQPSSTTNAASHAGADMRSHSASTAQKPYTGLSSPVGAHHQGNAYRRTLQPQQPITAVSNTLSYNPATRQLGSNGAFIRDSNRIDASTTMADSRYSRKSNSPSQSQISHSIPHSGESAKASSVEESYYLMNTDNDPADPVTTFLTVVENMVEELGNAVAFASAPLHIGPPSISTATNVGGLSHTRQHSGGHAKSEPSNHPSSKQAGPPPNQVLESFYVVPSINRPGKPAREGSVSDPSSAEGIARPSSAMNKTHEELVAENATLKETLDHLSKRLDWITKERQREKETLKDSVTMFARDVRRQAERLGQSTANLADTRRQMPPSMIPLSAHHHTHAQSGGSSVEELQRKLAQAQDETRAARAEAEKQAATAQKYKVRYDDLRKAILEKRKAKEMATAAAAAAASPSQANKETDDSISAKDTRDAIGKEESTPST
ncbi:hypothetical protein P389DRAFT_197642 [Cystobasidium minutum MCA 4210]|uniref:uncharacterized protein n=1 Tax=Cystobasidium minutum MCA 4210 TaxID=1397322 RepID=UPI0034CE626C|eukprot:jgi/Rhomi1/197642/gm1.5856_g